MKLKKTVSLFLSVVFVCTLLSGLSLSGAANIRKDGASVAGGANHSIAVKKDGTVWAWGSNAQKQLGISATVTETGTPTVVDGIASAVSVAAGYNFSVALKYNGTLYVWGGDKFDKPTEVSGISNVAAVSAAQTDILALTSDGSVYQWAFGGSPKKISSLSNIAAVSAGGAHFLAVTRAGEVWAWGANENGQLGVGSKDDADTPVKVPGLYNVTTVAAGFSHSLAATAAGELYAWGANTYGQLGDGTTDPSDIPLKIKKLTKITQLAAGSEVSLALTSDNRLYAWGYGEFGQLGQEGNAINKTSPSQITAAIGSGTPAYLTAGVYHCFCVTGSGENYTLYSWGRNNHKQLGVSREGNAAVPQQVFGSVIKPQLYNTQILAGTNNWAQESLNDLYDSELALPMLWEDYTTSVTRAEFACVLVNVYEQVKHSTVSENSSVEFTDVKGHKYENYINKAIYLKLISGSGNRFNPDNNITRQEAATLMCTFVSKMRGITIPSEFSNMSYYTDANSIAEWAAPFVDYAYKNNIMRGSNNKFEPRNNISRQETLVLITKLITLYDWKK